MDKSFIRGLPDRGEAAFQDDPEKFFDFVESLQQAIGAYAHGEVSFRTFDLSRVPLSKNGVDCLFTVMTQYAVHVDVLKVFKVGVDDEGLRLITAWLASLMPERLPSQLHLSHNHITRESFLELISCLEEQRALLAEPTKPVWTRVESNPELGEDVIRELVDAGRATHAARAGEVQMAGEASVCFPGFCHFGTQHWKPASQVTWTPPPGKSWPEEHAPQAPPQLPQERMLRPKGVHVPPRVTVPAGAHPAQQIQPRVLAPRVQPRPPTGPPPTGAAPTHVAPTQRPAVARPGGPPAMNKPPVMRGPPLFLPPPGASARERSRSSRAAPMRPPGAQAHQAQETALGHPMEGVSPEELLLDDSAAQFDGQQQLLE